MAKPCKPPVNYVVPLILVYESFTSILRSEVEEHYCSSICLIKLRRITNMRVPFNVYSDTKALTCWGNVALEYVYIVVSSNPD